jgi:tetratricopeptide (TPR) repeat protein
MTGIPTLGAEDVALLQQAFGQLQAGDMLAAKALIAKVPVAARHPDGLHLIALIGRAEGDLEPAQGALESALRIAPNHVQLLNSYAGLLADTGQGNAAIMAYERALVIAPDYTEAWVNLGITATGLGRLDVAQRALSEAARLAPDAPLVWNALGALARQAGDQAAAAQHFGKAIALNPLDNRARHNRAVALRALDLPQAALEEINRAIGKGPVAPETLCVRAHVLAETGQFDAAVEQYDALLATHPDHLDAHETLASLLPQLGRADEALTRYDRALAAAPQSEALWFSAISSAAALKYTVKALDFINAAEAQIGQSAALRLARASVLSQSGQMAEARELLLQMSPDDPGVAVNLSHNLLATGDPKRAEGYALRATQLTPLDQTAWSHLTIIWRLLGDAREAWLADYDRLVMPIMLSPPDGFDSLECWLSALTATLTDFHITRTNPAEQSLRGGTQTRGNLFDRQHPHVRALAATIKAAVTDRIAALPVDAAHPFLSRLTGGLRFAGSWSVRLASEGFHINHIHPSGWLSSACYISLPPEMGASDAGALAFGVPDAAFGLDLAPRRVEKPIPGKLVIFPSYLWHGTIPFVSASPRLTVAFDAMPQG